jgi:hypothetical protein
MLVGYADLRRFAAIRWDDFDQSFAPQFPWCRLRELIHEKADVLGIAFERTIRGKIKNRIKNFSATDRPSAINGGYA